MSDIPPNMVGAVIMIALGVMAMLRPQGVGEFIGVEPVDVDGRAELRAKLGGFFIALGVVSIVFNTYPVYQAVGTGWVGAAAARLASAAIDKAITWRIIAGVGVELMIAVLFFIRV